MSAIIKPIMFLMFSIALLSFINILLIFITVNQTAIVLNEAVYIVETYGEDTSSINSEIDNLEEKYNYKFDVSLEHMTDQEYTESTNVVVHTTYEYIGRNHTIEIEKNEIVMNKQL